MNIERAKYKAENMDRLARRDRILLNNPVVMQGLGLAPLVVAATTAENALMLSVAVAMLLLPVRVLAGMICRAGKLEFRWRGLVYCLVSASIYILVYLAMNSIYDIRIAQLGLYLPLLVTEPLIIKRNERPQGERLRTAVRKGVLTTLGYALMLMLMGSLREFLSLGMVFGHVLTTRQFLPMASLPAGGFILLGVVCAIWRGSVNAYKKHVNMEAKRSI